MEFVKNLQLFSLILVAAVAIASVNIAFAAPLSLPFVQPSNNMFAKGAMYTAGFNTATTGTIAKIEMTFPSGTLISNIKVADYNGIGAGTISVVGNTATYTVTSPVSVPSGTPIYFLLGKIQNTGTVGGQTISFTTLDGSDVIIDGSTTAPFQIQNTIGTTFIVDEVNGRVGIGTTTPLQKLDVNGNIRLTGNIVSPNDICIGTCP
jgi:hypothetical protein